MSETRSHVSAQYAAGARLYYECALAADRKVGLLPGFEIIAPFPVMHLVSHAIELSLKSSLIGRTDISERELRTRIGHDLERAYELCSRIAGYPLLSPAQEITLRNINFGHDGFVFRYGKLGKKYTEKLRSSSSSERKPGVPVFGPMQAIAMHFLRACEAPELEDLV